MVVGIGLFRERFRAHTDNYVLIGGAAVYTLMDQVGIDARATKDLDVVLLVESLNTEFGETFWQFIRDGGYEHRSKSSGEPCFYRFHSPKVIGYPYMIELFARRTGLIKMPPDAVITRIPAAEDVSSLSAIMLNDDYYDFVKSGAYVIDGLSLLGATHLIPLKARAWVDLSRRRKQEESIQRNEITKHRTDVVRLFALLAPDERMSLPSQQIVNDMNEFLESAFTSGYNPADVGVMGVTTEEMISILRAVFRLGS